MKNWIYIPLALFFCFLTEKHVQAQDIHYSQFYTARTLLNPAVNTHFEGDYRVGLNFKNQWGWARQDRNLTYRTFSLAGDMKWLPSFIPNGDEIGIGGYIMRDIAGNGELAFHRMKLNASYSKSLDAFNTYRLSFGAGIALVQRRVEWDRLTFDNQWDDGFFNPDLPSGEVNYDDAFYYPDISLGAALAIHPENGNIYRFGLSLKHVNRPKESFFGQDNRIGFRPVGQASGKVQLNNRINIYPSVYFTTQKRAMEVLGGGMIGMEAGKGSGFEGEFLAGAWYRYNDALIPTIGYHWNEWKLVMNYDVNLSSLTPVSRTRGGFELSLYYIGLSKKDAQQIFIPCPRM